MKWIRFQDEKVFNENVERKCLLFRKLDFSSSVAPITLEVLGNLIMRKSEISVDLIPKKELYL